MPELGLETHDRLKLGDCGLIVACLEPLLMLLLVASENALAFRHTPEQLLVRRRIGFLRPRLRRFQLALRSWLLLILRRWHRFQLVARLTVKATDSLPAGCVEANRRVCWHATHFDRELEKDVLGARR